MTLHQDDVCVRVTGGGGVSNWAQQLNVERKLHSPKKKKKNQYVFLPVNFMGKNDPQTLTRLH